MEQTLQTQGRASLMQMRHDDFKQVISQAPTPILKVKLVTAKVR